MTQYKCVYCQNILPNGLHVCLDCNEYDGCAPLKTFVVVETHRYLVEAVDEEDAINQILIGEAEASDISFTQIKEIN